MKHWVFLGWILCMVGWSAEGSATAAGPLVELGRPGPWAGVSGLITYGPRLYLVNSQIFVNHNAADVYSYHPGEGTLRFEQRLFSQDAGTQRLWRSDGHGSTEPITALDGYPVQALAATAETLWAVSAGPGGQGRVWRSADGLTWQQVQQLPARPVALTVVGDQVFVGTYDHVHGGALWGPATPRAFPTPPPQAQLLAQPTYPFTPSALAQALHELDRTLRDDTTSDYRQRLLTHLLPLALSRDPAAGQALSLRLYASLPHTLVPLFGGQVHVPVARLARWYLLYAVALNGYGWVPPGCLTTPWTASPNPAEKYLEPVLAAAWAVAELGQADPLTRDALHTALAGDLPDWARGDVLAALHRLTSSPFRYLTPSPEKGAQDTKR